MAKHKLSWDKVGDTYLAPVMADGISCDKGGGWQKWQLMVQFPKTFSISRSKKVSVASIVSRGEEDGEYSKDVKEYLASERKNEDSLLLHQDDKGTWRSHRNKVVMPLGADDNPLPPSRFTRDGFYGYTKQGGAGGSYCQCVARPGRRVKTGVCQWFTKDDDGNWPDREYSSTQTASSYQCKGRKPGEECKCARDTCAVKEQPYSVVDQD